ncbi:MAG: DUF3179 domain-containing protein [Gemmatimonadota bacterium]|nr:DUF3179 domain-containing protein [Gemmatimonadota bacterium]
MAGISYMTNFRMSADRIFLQPRQLVMEPPTRNRVAADRLVVGIALNGDARAYPIQFIGYHHQVRDKVGGQHVLVSYCTVCRTGRVFTPVVQVETRFSLRGDSLIAGERTYALNGTGPSGSLKPLSASQEFWHSWRTFQSTTEKY